MSDAVLVALIGFFGTLVTVAIVPLSIWAFRQWRANRATKRTALKTVESWEVTVENKNQQLEEWERRFNRLYEDFTRSREIIRDQDVRMQRKDERIAHLELLCDAKGTPS